MIREETFPNLRSNIPNSQAYGSFTGELYKLCKSSTCFSDFKDEVRMLMKNFKIKISMLLN